MGMEDKPWHKRDLQDILEVGSGRVRTQGQSPCFSPRLPVFGQSEVYVQLAVPTS